MGYKNVRRDECLPRRTEGSFLVQSEGTFFRTFTTNNFAGLNRMQKDPQHPILDRPHEYHILDLRFHVGEDGDEPFLDLILGRGDAVRRLRFLSPRDLEIESGFPMPTNGMEILDVRARQIEDIGVRVGDFEASPGSITFWRAR